MPARVSLRRLAEPGRLHATLVVGARAAVAEHTAARELPSGRHRTGDGVQAAVFVDGLRVGRVEQPPDVAMFRHNQHVGDAVKEYANGGTTACAETAQLVVDEIVATYSLTKSG